jgi:hypothetical protein
MSSILNKNETEFNNGVEDYDAINSSLLRTPTANKSINRGIEDYN